MNRFGTCGQWRNEIFTHKYSFFKLEKEHWTLRDIGNCAMMPVPCSLRDETSASTPRFFCPYSAVNFIAALGIILLANSCARWRGIFIGLSQDGGRVDFLKNFAPLPLVHTCRMNLISFGSISLGSTFFKDFFQTLKLTAQ
jgi:hypothetical protein